MNYDDLPANLRRRVDAAEGRQPRRTGKGGGTVAGGRWRCQCGEEFTVWTRAETHAGGAGHRRLACVLTPGR